MSSWAGLSKDTRLEILGSTLGVLASFVLLFILLGREAEATPGGGTTTGLRPTGIEYLLGVEGADLALFFWALFVLVVALVGGYGAVSETRALVWIAAIALLALTVLGLFSIGLFVAPAALFFLLAGLRLRAGRGAKVT